VTFWAPCIILISARPLSILCTERRGLMNPYRAQMLSPEVRFHGPSIIFFEQKQTSNFISALKMVSVTALNSPVTSLWNGNDGALYLPNTLGLGKWYYVPQGTQRLLKDWYTTCRTKVSERLPHHHGCTSQYATEFNVRKIQIILLREKHL
jgi:hypothetical protein